MIRRFFTSIPSAIVLVLIGLLSFTGVAHAATAVTGDDPSVMDVIRPVYQAFANHQYSLMVMLLIVALVALTKKYLGDVVPWLHTNAGGSTLVLIGSWALAMTTGLITPEATITLALVKGSLLAAIATAGGWVTLKNLVVDPFLKPLVEKSPLWLQKILNLVLFAFDHGDDATVEAEKAGDDAVKAEPAPGVEGVIGKPSDLK
jgi:hypothetical protein